ncbi:hypothetical protein D3C77_764760 [compost metagenome]
MTFTFEFRYLQTYDRFQLNARRQLRKLFVWAYSFQRVETPLPFCRQMMTPGQHILQ